MISQRHIPILFGLTLGFFATISQVVLMREFWTIPGLGELSLGLILCSWLVDIALGAELGKKVRFNRVSIFVVLCTCTLLSPAAILWVRHYETLFDVAAGEPLDTIVFLILCVTATLPAAIVSGMLFTSYAKQIKQRGAGTVQHVYMAEGVGAAVAGIGYTFIFSRALDPLTTALLAVCMLAVGAVAAVDGRTAVRHWLMPLFPLLLAVFTFAFSLNVWSLKLAFETQPVRGNFVACEDTRYQRLCLGRNAEQYQLYQDGRLAYVFPDPWDRPTPVHLAMIQHPAPERVLIIGGGVANRVDAALRYGPRSVHYLDFDPVALPFAMEFQKGVSENILSNPKVQWHVDYHRRFLNQHTHHYDVIIQFTSDPFTAAENAAHSVSFYEAIQHALSADGVLAVVSSGSANVAAPPAAQLMANRYRTMKKVFNRVVPVIDVQTVFYAANRNVLSTSPDVLENRLSAVDKSVATTINLKDIFSPFRLSRSRTTVNKFAGDINVDNYPRAFLHTMELRRWVRTSSLATLTDEHWDADNRAQPTLFWPLLLGALILVASALPLVRRGGALMAPLLSIGTTGMCGMGMEIVLIYRFSVIHGGLYHNIAWLLA